MNPLALATAASLLAATAPAQVISEQEFIASVLVAESGGEPVGGMQAVLEVIWTRHLEWEQTFWKVLTTRKAFSCLNKTTPQKLIAKSKQHTRWAYAMALCETMPKTRLAKRANHYCDINCNPYWARGKRPVAVIGNHKFYRIDNNKLKPK